MLTREDVIEKLRSGELTPQDIAANGWMCSVTQRISKIKQPRGGYIKPKEFEQTMLDGGGIDELHPEENVSPSLVGIAVDYLTRFMSGTSVEEVQAGRSCCPTAEIVQEAVVECVWIG